jgi:hypothetical protein
MTGKFLKSSKHGTVNFTLAEARALVELLKNERVAAEGLSIDFAEERTDMSTALRKLQKSLGQKE